MKLYVVIILIILLEVVYFRYKSASAFRKRITSSLEFTLPLKKDPIAMGYFRLLDFGYLRVKYYGDKKFRVGDVLKADLRQSGKNVIIEKVGEVPYAGILRFFADLKYKIYNVYKKNLYAPYGELLGGMTLGIDDLSHSFKDNLIKTGVIHVVVVSGFNITLVISALFPLFLIFGRKIAFTASILGIMAFVLMVGLEPPVIRAAIMGSIVLFGKLIGRERNILSILIFAGIVMLLINPLLIESLSFILSFLATFGLITLCPQLEKHLTRVLPRKIKPDRRSQSQIISGFGSDFFSTISAQVLVWPVISYYFGRVSIISPIVNLLVLWVVPIATVLGFLYAALIFILQFLHLGILITLISFIVKVPLIYFSQVVNFFADFPFAQINFRVGLHFLAFYYTFLLLLLLFILR